ncbi:flagellar assembly protein FliW [Gorillibacterium sp. sgz5001074]|uniref:flagellar assembly protein FliW n=1 Tax=Gorillibacterium sp. sgz5001074 TaxID=3446695 RepID=UPI003F66A871
MKLQTAQLGEIEYQEDQVIVFDQGIPGFEDQKEYILLGPEELAPFSILQSVQDGNLSFIVTDPFLFYKNYEIELSEPVQEQLEFSEEKDVAIWSIITLTGSLEDATINLQAPLVIHSAKRVGKQIILHDSPYKTRHRLFSNER